MTYTRATIAHAVTLPPAVGTLSRRPVTVRLEPAEPGFGLQVRRSDTAEQWPIAPDHLVAATNCTAVGTADSSVAFLEHLLAALWAAGISDLLIATDAPEIPLYDGSAAMICQALAAAGRTVSGEPWPPLVVTEPCHLLQEGRALLALPADRACYTYLLDHPHPLIGSQYAQFCAGGDFATEIAPARTFATAEQITGTRGQAPGPEVEALCVVVYDDRLSQQQPLPDPFARHKLLDLLGDLFLAGRPLQGAVLAAKTGHGDNHEFLRRLLAQEKG